MRRRGTVKKKLFGSNGAVARGDARAREVDACDAVD
jgi:hypothetical protein